MNVLLNPLSFLNSLSHPSQVQPPSVGVSEYQDVAFLSVDSFLGVLAYGHSHVLNPLVKIPEGHILHVYLISKGLHEPWCCFGAVEPHYLHYCHHPLTYCACERTFLPWLISAVLRALQSICGKSEILSEIPTTLS